MGEEKFMQTQVSPMTNRKPGRFGVLLCIFLMVGFALSFLGQPVQAQSPLAITTISLPEVTVGSPYTVTLTATGGKPPYVWAIAAGLLPPGLSLDSATGVISGVTPHEAIGSYVFTIMVKDMHDNTASKSLSLTVIGFYTATGTISTSLLQPWQMPILITTLVLLLIGLASYLGYRYAHRPDSYFDIYAQGAEAEPKPKTCNKPCYICGMGPPFCSKYPNHADACNSTHDPCTEIAKCPRCKADIAKSQCSLCKDGHKDHKFPQSEHELCNVERTWSNCSHKVKCSLCKDGHKDHIYPDHPRCGKPVTCVNCGTLKDVGCSAPCGHDGRCSVEHTCK